MHDRAFEYVVRVGVDGEGDTLPIFYVTYVGFVHVGYHLHLGQVCRDGEQGRSLEAGGHGLSFFNCAVDHDTVDRAGDRRIFEVAVHFDHCRLVLFVGGFCFLIVVCGRFIVRVADQLFFEEDLVAGVILLLVLEFALAACQLCLGGCEFGFQVDLVHFGDQLPCFDHVVIVCIQLVDDTGHLRADFDFRYRFDRTGCRYRVRDGTTAHFGGFEPDTAFRRFACEEPDASGHDQYAYYTDN